MDRIRRIAKGCARTGAHVLDEAVSATSVKQAAFSEDEVVSVAGVRDRFVLVDWSRDRHRARDPRTGGEADKAAYSM